MLHMLRKRLRREDGFTLIELLVVILIIGILAAIAIPSFLNQKGKGEDAAAKTAARETATALETYYTDNSSYDCTTATGGCDAALHAIESTIPTLGTAAGNVSVTPSGSTGYTITAYSKPTLRAFTITKTASGVSRSCTVPSGVNAGGCPNGTW